MILVKELDEREVESATFLLHEEYVKKSGWKFSNDNPSKIKVIKKDNKNFLVDRITPYAIWFGAFDNNKLIGCIRLFKAIENVPFEIETYPSAKNTVDKFIDMGEKNLYECSRPCVDFEYIDNGILEKLYLKVFSFCRKEKASLFGTSPNKDVHTVLKKIGIGFKKEKAFKFENTDPTPVSLYVLNFDEKKIDEVINTLKTLENELYSEV